MMNILMSANNEVIDGVVLTARISGLPQSKDNCKGRFFGLHIHERDFLHWKLRR